MYVCMYRKRKVVRYRLSEIEFYLMDATHHNDIFAHCDNMQFRTSSNWYFHRSGNHSFEGYQFVKSQVFVNTFTM